MRNLILILCCVFCFSSCWQYDLDSRKALMTDSLLAHFPEPSLTFLPYGGGWNEGGSPEMFQPYDLCTFVTIYIYKCHNAKKLSNLIQKYQKASLYTVMSEDTTYLTIDKGNYLKNIYRDSLYHIYEKHMDPLIIKYNISSQFYDPRTLCNLEPGWTICVLKSGSEYILPKGLRHDFNTLPPSYQHGYSSGVAFNEKEHKKYLICWAVAW